MPIRLSNLRLGVEEPEEALVGQIAAALDVPADELLRWRILRKSLDARDRSDVHFVYSLEVSLSADEEKLAARAARRSPRFSPDLYAEPPFEMPAAGSVPLAHRPVVVGSGPAGLMAAYFLADCGYGPLVLERGPEVRKRIADVAAFDAGAPHNPESNYLFGEGGAGTFSDGKLTCRASGPDVRRVLQVLADSKGKPSMLYEHRPHLGSNRLPAVVKSLRRHILAAGGEFRFDCRLDDVQIADGRIQSVSTSSGTISTDVLILAIGHSARDSYEMLHARGVPMIQKPFQLGLRIEQPQEQVNRVQYGPSRLEERLGAADYSLIARSDVSVFSFCMCAGGQVIASVSEPGHFATNGMSLSRRNTAFANSGLMVTLDPSSFGSDHPLAGMMLQRNYERLAFAAGAGEYRCPIQWADDFLAQRPTTGQPPSSSSRGTLSADVGSLVPPSVARALLAALPILDRRWRGEFLRNATLVGPESRGSSPIRFPRSSVTLESTGVAGLYPVGEGAGYAGGIVSAALDGLRAAKAIIARYAPLQRRG